MSDQIHAHEIIKMMLASGLSYTKNELCNTIIEHYGEEARFYSRSTNNMTAHEFAEKLPSIFKNDLDNGDTDGETFSKPSPLSPQPTLTMSHEKKYKITTEQHQG